MVNADFHTTVRGTHDQKIGVYVHYREYVSQHGQTPRGKRQYGNWTFDVEVDTFTGTKRWTYVLADTEMNFTEARKNMIADARQTPGATNVFAYVKA